MSDPPVSASEVHSYFYCPYAWWYENDQTDAGHVAMLKAGEEFHRTLDSEVAPSRIQRLKWLLLAAAAVLAVAAVVLLFVEH